MKTPAILTLLLVYGGVTDGLISYDTPNPRTLKSPLHAAPEGLKWFVKTETFAKPYPEVKRHLEAHREWVRLLREEGTIKIASGYRVDSNDRPGGGGLVSSSWYRHCIKCMISCLILPCR